MDRWMRRVVILALVAWMMGCAGPIEGEPGDWETEGAAGDPAFEAFGGEDSADFEEAQTLDELMARQPVALGVELPDDLVIEKKLVGSDDRVRIADTRVAPYSTIATLLVTFPAAAKPGLCTGSLIASDAVLTAAHCVYNAKLGGWAKSIRVVPGAYPNAAGVTQAPFGSASALRGFAPDAYRAATTFWAREPYDYAVVRIGAGLKNAPGTRAFGVMTSPKVNRAITLAGYHGDKCAAPPCSPSASSFIMHKSKDTIRELLPKGAAKATLFNHYADSNGGASGAPIVADADFANTIFAVHIAGFRDINADSWNMGVLLSATAVANIKSWMGRKL